MATKNVTGKPLCVRILCEVSRLSDLVFAVASDIARAM